MENQDRAFEALKKADPMKADQIKTRLNEEIYGKKEKPVGLITLVSAIVLTGGLVYTVNAFTGDEVQVAAEGTPEPTNSAVEPNAAGNESTVDLGVRGESTSQADMMSFYSGRDVFSSAGLDTTGGTAVAYGYLPGEVFTPEKASEVAEIFGVSGEPTLVYGSWTVGDEASGTIQLYPDGTGGLAYNNNANYFYPCEDNVTMPVEPGMLRGAVDPSNCEGAMEEFPALTEEEALASANTLLTGLGQNPEDYDLSIDGADSNFWLEAKTKTETGQQYFSFSYSPKGLTSFYGSIAPQVELGEYPTVSAEEAVSRLNDKRYGAFSDYSIYSDTAMVEPMPIEESEPTLPPTPVVGGPIPWQVNEITIVEAEASHNLQTLPTGQQMLLPTWKLTDASGSTWSVISLSDEALDFTAGK